MFAKPPFVFARSTVGILFPWVVATLVCSVVLTSVGANAVRKISRLWPHTPKHYVTLHVPSSYTENPSATQERIEQIQIVLRTTAGVQSVRLLQEKEAMEVLSVWAGKRPGTFPVPRIMEAQIEFEALSNIRESMPYIQKIAPGATLEDHYVEFDAKTQFLKTLEIVVLCTALLLIATLLFSIALATHMEAAQHRTTFELLGLMGVSDRGLADFLVSHVVLLAFVGILMGFIPAVLTLWTLAPMIDRAAQIDASLSILAPTISEWALLTALFFLLTASATLTSLWVARRQLRGLS